MTGSAVISPCGSYRYVLRRRVPCVLRWVRPCCFVMLNPSVADAEVDDPTIRRCLGFAASWECTELVVVNLYAWRATKPRELATAQDPVGPDNDEHVREEVRRARAVSGVVVVAWGAHPMARRPGRLDMRLWLLGADAHCLGNTKGGAAPSHPLFLRKDTALRRWRGDHD